MKWYATYTRTIYGRTRQGPDRVTDGPGGRLASSLSRGSAILICSPPHFLDLDIGCRAAYCQAGTLHDMAAADQSAQSQPSPKSRAKSVPATHLNSIIGSPISMWYALVGYLGFPRVFEPHAALAQRVWQIWQWSVIPDSLLQRY